MAFVVNRKEKLKKMLFLKSFCLAPWQKSNINLDMEVHLYAIIVRWMIVSDEIPACIQSTQLLGSTYC